MEKYFDILIILSFLLGGLIAWFLSLKSVKRLKMNNDELLERLKLDEIQVAELNRIQQSVVVKKAELEIELKLNKQKILEQEEYKNKLLKAQDLIQQMENDRIRLEENYKAEKEKLEVLQNDFKTQKEQLKNEFRVVANEILESNSSKFAEQSKKNIGDLIKPMKEKIEQFEKQVTDAYREDERERFSLKNELKNLTELNNNLSEEARNLALALKGDSKTQGDWGEMILENILEKSGLTKGREYFVQHDVTTDNNKHYRPDVVVKYPGNRCVIIDSKVSLKSYEAYTSSDNVEKQKLHLKAHIDSVKKHIKELSAKNYQSIMDNCASPDFVMMFLPIEPAYMLAVQNEPELWSNAYDKQILLISPTNLIAALRMIAELWEHDKQNKNVMKIAEESGKLVDKFIGFLDDFDKVGDYLRKSEDAFEKAKKKIKDGSGNLVGKAKLISKLGATAKKTLPQNYLIDDENE